MSDIEDLDSPNVPDSSEDVEIIEEQGAELEDVPEQPDLLEESDASSLESTSDVTDAPELPDEFEIEPAQQADNQPSSTTAPDVNPPSTSPNSDNLATIHPQPKGPEYEPGPETHPITTRDPDGQKPQLPEGWRPGGPEGR
jgi:hypothetical protein